MNSLFEMETYLPNRPPTWLEVFMLVGLLPLAVVVYQWYAPLSLPAVGLGFVGIIILIGPVSQTRHGKRLNQWEWEPGVVERVGVSISFVLFGIGLITVFSKGVFYGLLFGAFLACALGLAVHVLRDRQIEDLTPPEW
jgi:hypothetical protein